MIVKRLNQCISDSAWLVRYSNSVVMNTDQQYFEKEKSPTADKILVEQRLLMRKIHGGFPGKYEPKEGLLWYEM